MHGHTLQEIACEHVKNIARQLVDRRSHPIGTDYYELIELKKNLEVALGAVDRLLYQYVDVT